MIRRHFFLVIAVCVVALMAVGATWKLTLGKKGAAGGPPGAAAPGGKGPAGQGPGGAAGGPQAKGPGGPGGPGGRGGGAGRGGATVTAVAAQTRTFVDRLQVLGVAKGRESVTLTSNSAELIDAVRFRPGDNVRKGQVLVELRRTEEDAGVAQARTNVELARINAQRWAELGTKGFAPKATVEQYAATYEVAKSALEAAESRQGDRVIKAPFTGVVGLTDIAPGALISPGTAIATLDDVSIMRVDFDIPDRFLAFAKEGGLITATTDAYPGEKYTGRIAKLDTRIDERSRSIKARAEFPNPGSKLKPGMLMRVGVDRGTRQSLGVPESAVNFTGGQAYVYKIAIRGEGSFAQQTPIVPGSNDCGYIEVREGLAAGERVIADGLNRIQPNQALTVVAGPGARGGRGGPGGRGPGGPGGAAAKGPATGQAPAEAGPQAKAGGAPAMKGPQGREGGRGGMGRGPGGRPGGAVVTSQPGCANTVSARGGPGAGRPGGMNATGGRDAMGRGPGGRPGGGMGGRSGPVAAK